MRSLSNLDIKLLNINTYYKEYDGKKVEKVRIDGVCKLSEKQKENVISGEYQSIVIFDTCTPDYDGLLQACHDNEVDTIHFKGYYDNFVFKPCEIIGWEKIKK